MIKPKIFVLIPIYPYVEPLTMDRINDQTFQGEYDVMSSRYNPVDPHSANWGANLAYKQNKAKQICLNHNYTHLFLLESDVVPPSEILETLLAQDKMVISGWYELHSHSGSLAGKPSIFRNNKVLYPGVDFPIGSVELVTLSILGCTLIKSEVLRYINFNQGTDAHFSAMCYNLGFEMWVHTGMYCAHVDRYKKEK